MLQYYNSLTARIFDAHEIVQYTEHWTALCKRTIEDNVYYMPQYALSLLNSVDSGFEVQFVTIWQGSEMIGLLPVIKNKRCFRGIRPIGQAWISPYTFNGMPLIDQTDPVGIAGAMIDCLGELGHGDWLLKDIYSKGPTAEAFRQALDGRNLAWSATRSYNRASMGKSISYKELFEKQVPPKRRKDLRRNDRRLRDLGTVTYEIHEKGEGLKKAVEAFLELEKGGWKGAKGTALACDKKSLQFAKEAFVSEGSAKTRVDLLLLDGKPIAAGVIVFAGDTAFTIKGAYNEEYRNYSVGLLLELEVAKSFLDGNWAKRLDSATAGVHVIDFLWPDKCEVVDYVFATSQSVSKASLDQYQRTQQLHDNVKAFAKKILKR
jgi:CelD/BcsL family acetyltransferase involved in cellulose biosynthesis